MILFITLKLLCRIQKTAILHIGVNDLLKRDSNIDVVTNNIMKIANECKTYGIKNVFVSGLTYGGFYLPLDLAFFFSKF